MSPLEQFEIVPILNLLLIIITNSIIILSLGYLFIFFYIKLFKKGILIPGRSQTIFEGIFNVVFELIYSNIGKQNGSFFFPLIYILIFILLLCNLIGMVPYSFTVTSHLIITFSIALTLYIGFNYISLQKHKIKFLNLFLPGGADLMLAPLLIPIELISYIFRVISLPVRLFANMMAGHTLLKVIASFAWIMSNLNFIFFILHFIPLFILILLIGLELGVALIQSYVFSILTCMYIKDALNLH